MYQLEGNDLLPRCRSNSPLLPLGQSPTTKRCLLPILENKGFTITMVDKKSERFRSSEGEDAQYLYGMENSIPFQHAEKSELELRSEDFHYDPEGNADLHKVNDEQSTRNKYPSRCSSPPSPPSRLSYSLTSHPPLRGAKQEQNPFRHHRHRATCRIPRDIRRFLAVHEEEETKVLEEQFVIVIRMEEVDRERIVRNEVSKRMEHQNNMVERWPRSYERPPRHSPPCSNASTPCAPIIGLAMNDLVTATTSAVNPISPYRISLPHGRRGSSHGDGGSCSSCCGGAVPSTLLSLPEKLKEKFPSPKQHHIEDVGEKLHPPGGEDIDHTGLEHYSDDRREEEAGKMEEGCTQSHCRPSLPPPTPSLGVESNHESTRMQEAILDKCRRALIEAIRREKELQETLTSLEEENRLYMVKKCRKCGNVDGHPNDNNIEKGMVRHSHPPSAQAVLHKDTTVISPPNLLHEEAGQKEDDDSQEVEFPIHDNTTTSRRRRPTSIGDHETREKNMVEVNGHKKISDQRVDNFQFRWWLGKVVELPVKFFFLCIAPIQWLWLAPLWWVFSVWTRILQCGRNMMKKNEIRKRRRNEMAGKRKKR